MNKRDVSLDQLNYMQRYVATEMVDMYREGRLTRRTMLRRVVAICGGAAGASLLLTSCGESTSGMSGMLDAASGGSSGASDAAGGAGGGTGSTDAGAPDRAGAADAAGGADAAAGGADAGAPDRGAAADAATARDGGPAALSVPANDPAIDGADIKFMADVELFGYLAKPRAGAKGLGVVVIHENRGLTDHIRDVARRLAKAGYHALAIDLCSRGGGTDKIDPNMVGAFLSAPARLNDLVKDLGSAMDHLGTQAGVKNDRFGVVGFCYGGGMTWRAAAAHPKVKAAVPYYGPAPDPLDILKTTNAAILGQYGETDSRVNGAMNSIIAATEKTLTDAGKIFDKRIHAGAGHAFNNDTGGSYQEAAAVSGWKDTLAWFDKYLGA